MKTRSTIKFSMQFTTDIVFLLASDDFINIITSCEYLSDTFCLHVKVATLDLHVHLTFFIFQDH